MSVTSKLSILLDLLLLVTIRHKPVYKVLWLHQILAYYPNYDQQHIPILQSVAS